MQKEDARMTSFIKKNEKFFRGNCNVMKNFRPSSGRLFKIAVSWILLISISKKIIMRMEN